MLIEWFMIVTVVLLAAISPGPDFVMTVRNTVCYGRRAGIVTAIGFGLAICVHVFYCMIGIAAVISQSILLFTILKYLGAAYLVYLGVQALKSTGYSQDISIAPLQKHAGKTIADRVVLRQGFLTNLLNPKATLFFLSLYTQVLDPGTPIAVQLVYGATAAVVVPLWFSCVALFLSDRRVKNAFLHFSKWIDRICGGCLVALGLKLAVTETAR
jgi:RhtB (resistance to homoserine/threonine) family protein